MNPSDFDKNVDGIVNQPLALTINGFELKRESGWGLHQHHVIFEPVLKTVATRKKLIKSALKSCQIETYWIDTTSLFVYTPTPITSVVEPLHFNGTCNEEGEFYPLIQINLVYHFKLMDDDETYDQFFDTKLCKWVSALGLQKIDVNGQFCDLNDTGSHIMLEKRVLYPVYNPSIKIVQNGVIRMTVISCFKKGSLDTVLQSIQTLAPSTTYRHKAERSLVGSVIFTNYNKKVYRVLGIDWSKTPNDKFEWNKQQITFAAYLDGKYGSAGKVRKIDQPMISALPVNNSSLMVPVLLVPELCKRLGLYEEETDTDLMADLEIADARQKELTKGFVDKLLQNEHVIADLSSWGLEFHIKMTQCQCGNGN